MLSLKILHTYLVYKLEILVGGSSYNMKLIIILFKVIYAYVNSR